MSARPLLLGHRGARAVRSIPENTFASFDHALGEGCDGFEFDVRLTSDRQAVICHDPKFGSLEIAHAAADQLAGLARLGDLLHHYRNSAFLDIELKVPDLEKITADLLKASPPRRGFVVSSFLPEVLLALHAEDCSIPLGLICETSVQFGQWQKLPVQYVIPHHRLLSGVRLRELHAAGKKVLVWTVNDPAKMRRLAGLRVEGIISDDARLLAQTLA